MNIAILGAGVAGLSTAIALRQCGFDVHVYERNEIRSPLGAGIVLWPNASFVLSELGVLDRIRQVSARPGAMRRLSSDDEFLGEIDIHAIDQQMGYSSFSILRRDLQEILLSKLSSYEVNVEYARPVKDIEAHGSDRTAIRFEHGSGDMADIVVGADGRMKSVSRRFVTGENRPVFQRFINWIGVGEAPTSSAEEIIISDYWGVGKRFGIVPTVGGGAYWAGGVACDEIGHRNKHQYKKELKSHFSDWPAPVREIIEQTPMERINKIYVHDHDPITTWHRRNVVLVGDAAHAPLPTSGQGACQALEDAWHLANCLSACPDDLQRAFTDFTRIRLQKTTNITLNARNFASSLFNTDKTACESRNHRSKETDFGSVARAMASGWAKQLPLAAPAADRSNVIAG